MRSEATSCARHDAAKLRCLVHRLGPLTLAGASVLGCVFVEPPPLPEELEAQQAALDAAKASRGAATPAPGGEAGSGAGEETGESGVFMPEELEGTTPAPIVREDGAVIAPAGMSEAEIWKFNKSQGDPIEGAFPLTTALAGLPGKGSLWAVIETTKGTMDCKLDEANAPRSVANFVGLARGVRPFKDLSTGEWVKRPFYDNTNFFRVDPGFMIQGGDPLGTGFGGPGYVIPDEHSPRLRHDEAGVLSMANRGSGTTGAQFFITLGPASHLDGGYNIIGRCSKESVMIADDIAMVPRDQDDRPSDPDTIKTIKIERR